MLVSVIVATYNCAKYIEQTLNSVLAQTYSELELIVVDDKSSDDTNRIVTHWLSSNKSRFVNVVHVESPCNTGVTKNYHRGLLQARGTWVKCLDGDDLLEEHAIERYVRHIAINSDCEILYAGEQLMDLEGNCYQNQYTEIPTGSAAKQLDFLLTNRLAGLRTTTNFFNKDRFLSFGGFDSRYPMYQDGPLFLHFLINNYAIGVIPELTVLKRENPNSLMHTANPVMVENISRCIYDFSCLWYKQRHKPFHYYNAWLTYFIAQHYNESYWWRLIGYFLRCFDFVHWMTKLKKHN